MEAKEAPLSAQEEKITTEGKKDVGKSVAKGNDKEKGKSSKNEIKKQVQKKTTEPAKRVLTSDEIGRMIDLGLGRGVNATSSTPWFQKSSFQVREVTPHNVVGTEEGGILQSFVNEVESVQDIQSEMSASIPASDQVSIGIDAELSRSYSTTRKSMGKKIITRSISFIPDLDEVQPADALHVVPATPQLVAASADIVQDDLPLFEQRLALWIIERLLDDGIKDLEEPTPGVNPVNLLTRFMVEWPGGIAEVKDIVRQKCREFVSYFNITHFVSSIELGASHYEVLSEEQFLQRVGVKNSLEVLRVVGSAFETRRSTKRRTKSSQATEIGRIEGDNVLRGTTGEAVVGVKFRPVSALVKLRILQSLLQSAIKNFIDDQEHSKAGPFIISCNTENIFLKVTPNFQVVATSRIEDSSDFYIRYNEDGRSAYEFSIVYMSPSSLEGREIKPISRYLYAPVNTQGKFRGPLTLRLNAHDTHSKMTLHSRREKHSDPVDTKDWLSSRDIFYISCKQRVLLRNSYLSVKRMPRRSAINEEYTTYCVPTVKRHDESREHYMLFRLIRAIKRLAPVVKKKKDPEEEPLGIRRKYSTLARVDSVLPLEGGGSGIRMNMRSEGGREGGKSPTENETRM